MEMRAEKEGRKWEIEHGLNSKKARFKLSDGKLISPDGFNPKTGKATEIKRQSVGGTAAEKVPMAVLKLERLISEKVAKSGEIILCGKFWRTYPWLDTFLALSTRTIRITLCAIPEHYNH